MHSFFDDDALADLDKPDAQVIDGQFLRSFFALGGIYADLEDALNTKLDLLSRLPDSAQFRENLKRDEVLIYEQ